MNGHKYMITEDQINRIRGRVVAIDEIAGKLGGPQIPPDLVRQLKANTDAIFEVMNDVRANQLPN